MDLYEIMLQLIRSAIVGISDDAYVISALKQVYENDTEQNKFFSNLLELSKHHDMAHAVGCALDRIGLMPDSDIGTEFKKQVFLAVSRYEGLEYELSAVKRVLKKHQIDYLPLKGAVIRQYYSEPWMRTSCDVDILVHEEDLPQAQQALTDELNYHYDGTGRHDMGFHAPSGMHLELHYSLIEDGVVGVADKPLLSVWEHAHKVEEGSYEYALDDALFYYYHIAHMAKHFVQGGCGIRPFMDIKVLMDRIDIRADKVRALISAGDLELFVENAHKLSLVWFGDLEHDDITRRMEEYLLYGGTYGSLANRVAVEQGIKGGKWQYLRGRIWIPYEHMKYYYPSVESHRRMIFFYQVRRWLRIIFTGRIKRPFKEIKINGKMSKTRVDMTGELLSELGLKV
jgi:hypothetical protein